MNQSVFNRISSRALRDISALTALTEDVTVANNDNVKLERAACELRGLLGRPSDVELTQLAKAA
jgi:hypothetical protein